MEKRAKRAKREQKNSRIEKNIEDFLKDWHIKEERKKRLDALGFVWDKLKNEWETGFRHLKDFFNKYKHIRVSREYRPEDGFKLESWAVRQRFVYRKGKLSKGKISKLDTVVLIFFPSIILQLT